MHVPTTLPAYLGVHGRPIRYGHVDHDWPLSAYQTVYADEPGSAEMPSAGRAFTEGLITTLVSRGVGVSPIVLHAGVGSLETGELPAPEPFRVSATTAQRVNATRANGGQGHRRRARPWCGPWRRSATPAGSPTPARAGPSWW